MLALLFFRQQFIDTGLISLDSKSFYVSVAWITKKLIQYRRTAVEKILKLALQYQLNHITSKQISWIKE